MHVSLPRGLAIAAAATDADLEDMIVVRAAADPDRPSPRIENLRHNLTAQKGLVFLVARLENSVGAADEDVSGLQLSGATGVIRFREETDYRSAFFEEVFVRLMAVSL